MTSCSKRGISFPSLISLMRAIHGLEGNCILYHVALGLHHYAFITTTEPDLERLWLGSGGLVACMSEVLNVPALHMLLHMSCMYASLFFMVGLEFYLLSSIVCKGLLLLIYLALDHDPSAESRHLRRHMLLLDLDLGLSWLSVLSDAFIHAFTGPLYFLSFHHGGCLSRGARVCFLAYSIAQDLILFNPLSSLHCVYMSGSSRSRIIWNNME
ncbi:hypothetical protein LIER_40982 [Lithospermum erythrorhizon]|uniref:Uncharacterized protein n=1 Tax=Lithospermum erythrorhizon TaxID=34254 RepID=A0AAV3R5G6_LITER